MLKVCIFYIYLRLGLGESQVGLDLVEVAELFLSGFVRHGGRDDDVFTFGPVDRGGNALGVSLLQSVDHSQHFSSVSPSQRRVGHDQSHLLGGVNDEHQSHGEHGLFGDLLEVGFRQHVVQVQHFQLLVSNDGELELGPISHHFLDVLDPLLVRGDPFRQQPNQLDASLVELRLQLGEGAQFGGAHGGEVGGVGEQDGPLVADPVVEVDFPLGGVDVEVGRLGAKSDSRLLGGVERDEASQTRGGGGGSHTRSDQLLEHNDINW